MKVAIYIEDGVTQLVLTPETEWEKSATFKLANHGEYNVSIKRGSFYECRGGYLRQSSIFGTADDDSLILRMDRRAPLPPEVAGFTPFDVAP